MALKPRGKEHVGLCPFHDDSRPSMYVSPAKQIFKCFACGAGGNAFNFMMLREKMSFPEAVELLAERAHIELPKKEAPRAAGGVDRNELEAVNRWAARYFFRQYEEIATGAKARTYVHERGIADDVARKFGIGYAPGDWQSLRNAAEQAGQRAASLVQLGLLVQKDEGGYYDRFRDRLIFPVIDALGRIIAFGGRTLADDPAKYLNSPESPLFDKSRALYGIHAAKDAIIKSRTAIVVEGYTDCIMAHQFGVNNVVATLGTALTGEHARGLSRYADTIVLLFDSDAAGQKAADRAVEIFFGQRVQVKLASVPEGKDPCDYLLLKGAEAFSQVVRQAVDALEFKWQSTRAHLEAADTLNGRKRAIDEFLLLIANALTSGDIDNVSQGLLVNNVSSLIGLPAKQVKETLNQLQKRLNPKAGAGQTLSAPARVDLLAGDSYAHSLREVLEVLLNRPELFAVVKATLPGPDEYKDEVLKPIAERIWDYCSRGGTGSVAEMTATCQSPVLCSIMTELAQRGSERGNFEATLAGALRNLEREKQNRQRQEYRELASEAARKYGEDAETAMLQALMNKWQPDPRRPGAR